jgi:hypothetical protein
MGLAPAPMFPERPGTQYEVNPVSGAPSGPGPLYFEEGIGTDTDVPNEFQTGAMQGYLTPPGRSNHNANVYIKSPEETMSERAHVGSAAWVEAPLMLQDFAIGSFSDAAEVRYEEVYRSGGRLQRPNPAAIND